MQVWLDQPTTSPSSPSPLLPLTSFFSKRLRRNHLTGSSNLGKTYLKLLSQSLLWITTCIVTCYSSSIERPRTILIFNLNFSFLCTGKDSINIGMGRMSVGRPRAPSSHWLAFWSGGGGLRCAIPCGAKSVWWGFLRDNLGNGEDIECEFKRSQ